MEKSPRRRYTIAALLFCGVAGIGHAQAPAALPPLQTQGEVSYLSGGIGSDEVEAIKAARDRFALSVSLSARSDGRDVYLAEVPLTIRDDTGRTVLELVSQGPYLLAQLPPGRYELSASYGGEEKKSVIRLAAGRPQRVALSWTRLASDANATVPAAAASVAPPAVAERGAPARDPALPPLNAQGGVPYLSGGIGSDEAAAIKAAASRYSLSVTLSASEDGHGVFIASVPVTVSDASGATLLDIVTDGPYLLADLPPGRYVVRARYAEQDKTATVNVRPGQTARLSFAWSTTAR
ncbi:carboxypeptidase-like regulatory domain-containing protein [Solimonas soli]|uniref:carboxypeptidase-like regulatory domain-containing protein n=1 Tax=Solimonas soli TaxID=413479 RepID=UPI000481A8F3|nr:carboxypeptidase-like regulatory domain-containing protein [Solimonas soli]